jgi:hypothetical protein
MFWPAGLKIKRLEAMNELVNFHQPKRALTHAQLWQGEANTTPVHAKLEGHQQDGILVYGLHHAGEERPRRSHKPSTWGSALKSF